MSKYSPELRQKVLSEFQQKIPKPWGPAAIKKGHGIELFESLTGKTLSIAGIINFLANTENPGGGGRFNKKTMKSLSTATNPLFSSLGDKRYVLVPSHGDAASFDNVNEVKEAIEKCTSSNLMMIKFKLLEVRAIEVKTTVTCEIK
jgi:hypothetical protein